MKRKSERNKCDEDGKKRTPSQSKSDLLTVRRFTRLLIESCPNLTATAFTPWSLIVPFALPAEREDFSIPEEWKKLCSQPAIRIPKYRSLMRNSYKPPLHRGCCSVDDIPLCSCSYQDGCNIRCQNRLLFMECVIGNCPSTVENSSHRKDCHNQSICEDLSSCLNTSIQTRSYPPCEVFKTGACGYGLKVGSDVSASTLLIEYTGEVITASECSNRMRGMKERDDFYFASLGGGLMLDAKNMGSVARFANHSCEPNCELQKWSVLGESCIVLASKRAIRAGEELTYNYQYYEDGLDGAGVKMKRQKCLCGSTNCSGTIGGRVVASETDAWTQKSESLLSGARKHSLVTFTDHILNANKWRICKDSEELKSLQKLVAAAEQWKLEKNELFKTHEESGVLITVEDCTALLDRIPMGIRLDEGVALEALVRKVLRIERAIRSIDSDSHSDGLVPDQCGNSDGPALDVCAPASGDRSELCATSDDFASISMRCGSSSVINSDSSSSSSDSSSSNSGSSSSSSSSSSGINSDSSSSSSSCSSSDSGSSSSSSSSSSGINSEGSNSSSSSSNNSSSSSDNSNSSSSSSVDIRSNSDSCSSRHGIIAKQISPSRPSLLEGAASHSRDFGSAHENPTGTCINIPDQSHVESIEVKSSGESAQLGLVESVSLVADTTDRVCDLLPSPTEFHGGFGLGSVQCETATDGVDLGSRKPNDGVSVAHRVKKVMHWDELTALTRDVASVLPMKCRKAEVLLGLFNTVNEWTVRHLGGILHHSPFADIYVERSTPPTSTATSTLTNQGITVQDLQECSVSSARQKKMNPLVPILNRISLHYGCSPVHIDTFAAEDFLEFRVGLFMERMDALRGGGKSINIAMAKAECVSQHLERRAPSGTESPPPVGVICLCHMPDGMGETPVMSQCDTCDRWFHPNCTNALLVSRTASQVVETFQCPLCLHERGRPSNFAFKPISEWRVSIHALQGKRGRPKDTVSTATIPDPISKPVKTEIARMKMKKTLKSDGSKLSQVIKMESLSGSCGGGGKGVGTEKVYQSRTVSQKKRADEGKHKLFPLKGNTMDSAAISQEASETLIEHADCDIAAGVEPSDDDLHVSSDVSPSATIAIAIAIVGAPIPVDIPKDLKVLDMKGDITIPSNCMAHIPSLLPASLLSVPISKPAVPQKKIHRKKLSHDPMTVMDVTVAMAGEKELQVHKSPAALLLGLCSVYVQEWRVRARTFLTSSDVQRLVSAPCYPCPDYLWDVEGRGKGRGRGDDMSCTDQSGSQSQSACQNTCQSATISDSLSMSIGSQCSEYHQMNRRVTETREKNGNESRIVESSDSESDTYKSECESRKCSLLLLEDAITLYLEPRLLRIQPPETLDLRALAFLISARTAVKSISTPIPIPMSRHLSSSSTISTDSQRSVHHTAAKRESDSKDIIKTKKNAAITSRKEDGLLALKELKMIVEGGRHFLALRQSTLKKDREVQHRKDLTVGHGSQIDTCLSANTVGSAATEAPVGRAICESLLGIQEIGQGDLDLVSDFREKIYKQIECVTAAVLERFTRCVEALSLASKVKCSSSLTGCENRLMDLGSNSSHVLSQCDDHRCGHETQAHSKDSTPPFDLYRADLLLKEAGEGIFLKDEYAYARLQNMLLPSMKKSSIESQNSLLLTDQEFCITKNSTAPVISDSDSIGRSDGSSVLIDEVKRYCWCRGADDGSPMVQCDGCDEWFHSSCMGITKQKATAQEGSKLGSGLGSGSGLGREAVEGVLPVPPIAAGKSKAKTKGTAIKTTKQLMGVVDTCFYCIACAEDRAETYPHRWASDYY